MLHGIADIEQGEFVFNDVQLAGLHPGQVENVVYQAEQALAQTGRGVHVLGLLGIEFGEREQLQHAEHAVHGSADFVAHVGQELGLGPGGGLGLLLGLLQFLFGLETFEFGGGAHADQAQNRFHQARRHEGPTTEGGNVADCNAGGIAQRDSGKALRG